MSIPEIAGTVCNLISVYLASRNNIWNWIIGIVGSALFLVVFFNVQLYADVFNQLFFIITGVFGLIMWLRNRVKVDDYNSAPITKLTRLGICCYSLVTLMLLAWLYWVTTHLHTWYPALYKLPAAYPATDSLIVALSWSAMLLMMQKKLECWFLWITIDVIAVPLYFAKGIFLIAGLYLLFFALAIQGFVNWRRRVKEEKVL